MKKKYDVFDKFKNWKTLVESQTSMQIKTLRTDNGLEFCNTQMDDLCKQYGIRRHRTIP